MFQLTFSIIVDMRHHDYADKYKQHAYKEQEHSYCEITTSIFDHRELFNN